MDTPYSMVTNSDIPFPLPNPFGGLEAAVNYQGRPVTFWRKGKVIYRPRPKKQTPRPTQPNKFNTNPKGPRLTASCLPQDSPQHLKLFNDTATRHVAKLEAELGSN